MNEYLLRAFSADSCSLYNMSPHSEDHTMLSGGCTVNTASPPFPMFHAEKMPEKSIMSNWYLTGNYLGRETSAEQPSYCSNGRAPSTRCAALIIGLAGETEDRSANLE